jgi:hypothetical protein
MVTTKQKYTTDKLKLMIKVSLIVNNLTTKEDYRKGREKGRNCVGRSYPSITPLNVNRLNSPIRLQG